MTSRKSTGSAMRAGWPTSCTPSGAPTKWPPPCDVASIMDGRKGRPNRGQGMRRETVFRLAPQGGVARRKIASRVCRRDGRKGRPYFFPGAKDGVPVRPLIHKVKKTIGPSACSGEFVPKEPLLPDDLKTS